MVQEAEDYSEEDRAVKERTDAKNSLESYLYNMKNVLHDEEGGVASKVSDADKEVSFYDSEVCFFPRIGHEEDNPCNFTIYRLLGIKKVLGVGATNISSA